MLDISEARIVQTTESELAAARIAEGAKIVHSGGVFWEPTGAPGFYQPLNTLRPLSLAEAAAAPTWRWGHRAVLRAEDAHAANGTLPAIRLPDLGSYGLDRLQPRRRSQVRKAQRETRVVQLTGSGLLEEQGYEVVIDCLARTGYRRPPAREEYLRKISRYDQSDYWCVLAGLVDGRLASYLERFVVDGVAYCPVGYTASWALRTNIYTRLMFEFVLLCQRTPGVTTIMNGYDTPEDATLMQYKRSLGFVVDHLPLLWRINPVARLAVKTTRPRSYYRLTGTHYDHA